jgi:hypothetical protein
MLLFSSGSIAGSVTSGGAASLGAGRGAAMRAPPARGLK